MGTWLDGVDLLARWIERSKLSQLKAAERIGIDPTQLNQILKRKRRPGLDNAVRIERGTGIAVEAWVPFGDDEAAKYDLASDRKRTVGKA